MLKFLSHKMTCFFIRKNVIEQSEEETYDYCFEILLSTLMNLFSIIIIAVCTQTYLSSFLFIVIFMIMRSLSGGYHADTHFRCFLILLFVYFGLILSIKFLPNVFFISLIFNVFSLILYPILAPVEHYNNPMDKIKKRKLKVKSILASLIIICASSVMVFFTPTEIIGFTMAYTNFVVVISCLFSVFKNKLLHNKAG